MVSSAGGKPRILESSNLEMTLFCFSRRQEARGLYVTVSRPFEPFQVPYSYISLFLILVYTFHLRDLYTIKYP